MYAIKEELRRCETCGQISKTTLEYLIHKRIHRGNGQCFDCQICNVKFKYEESLNEHCKRNHQEASKGNNCSKPAKQYKCDLCGKCFSTHNSVILHIKIHVDQKPYCCKFCSRSFQRLHHLERHIATLHSQTRKQTACDHKFDTHIVCQICGRRLVSLYYLKRHMQKHSVTKQYKCFSCGNKYFHESSLYKHVKAVHSTQTESRKIWKYSCEVCDRKFHESHALKRHLTIHTGDREALCLVCNREFTRLTSLVRHIGRKHPHLKMRKG